MSEVVIGKKGPSGLALADKLDVARTLVRLEKRVEARHELDVIEAEIIKSHTADLADGRVRGVDLKGLMPSIIKEITSGV